MRTMRSFATSLPGTARPVRSAHTALVQRSCGCGGSCDDCRERKGGGAPAIDARLGHDFGRVRVHQQTEEEGEEPPKYSVHGIRVVHAGSGTCQNGGAESVCDPETGVFDLVVNKNTCCTKDCTAEHEAIHKKDYTGWGCCKALSTAWAAKGADKAKLIEKYEAWQDKVVPISECTAYTNDVACAEKLAKTKDCDGKGKDTDCCKDVADYKTKYGKLAKKYCDMAPAKAEPCPTF